MIVKFHHYDANGGIFKTIEKDIPIEAVSKFEMLGWVADRPVEHVKSIEPAEPKHDLEKLGFAPKKPGRHR